MSNIDKKNHIIDLQGIYLPTLTEKQKRLYLWTMFIKYLTMAKSNIFLKTTFQGSDRLNEILSNNRWYRRFPYIRQQSIFYGSSWVTYYKSEITNDITIKVLNSILVQYVDNILIKFSGTTLDIYPDTTKVYDYYEYELINNKYVTFNYGKLTYSVLTEKWEIKDLLINPIIYKTSKIPVTEFPNNELAESSFKDKEYLINLCIDHLLKIDKDIKLGTNKFLLNIRGIPTGKAFINTLKQYEEILEKGTIVTDQMLMINPNSANPLDRMYGSLQSEQLWYGFKQSFGNLKEQFNIATNSQQKTSAQQNTLEIMQESSLIDNDNQKLKYIWEEVLKEFAYNLLLFDNDILLNSNNLSQEINVTIQLNKTIQQLDKGNVSNPQNISNRKDTLNG